MSAHKPILSIIIPSYNISKYVDFCVPTFINDNLIGKICVLFIDDGATDDTKYKLEPFLEKYPELFTFASKDNGGHGSVINYALRELIKTKYFKVIDGDDWISSSDLLRLVNYLYNCDDDLIVSNYMRVYSNKQTFVPGILSNSTRSNKIDNYNIVLHSCTFKTSIFVDNHIFIREKVFYDDIEYVLFPLLYINSFSYCECTPYFYRLDNPNQSVSTLSMLKHYDDLCLIVADISSFLNEIKKVKPHFYNKCLAHASQCLGGYYFVPLNSSLSTKELRKMLIAKDRQLKNECPELRKTIKNTNLFSRTFFAMNFFFVGLLRKRKKQ